MIEGSESCFLSFVSTVSVIIPTLNEADRIGDTLFALERTLVHEVIVVDAGSEDATREIAAESECRLVTTDRPGRAAQLNQGASESEGTILLFLHADTVVPLLSIKHMKYAMDRADGFVGGGFARRFDSRSPFLAVTTRLAGLRSRLFGLFLGDQGIFVRRDAFDLLDGFREDMVAGEDLDFSWRMRRLGKTVTISPPVRTSARRFRERGAVRQTMADWKAGRAILKEAKNRQQG